MEFSRYRMFHLIKGHLVSCILVFCIQHHLHHISLLTKETSTFIPLLILLIALAFALFVPVVVFTILITSSRSFLPIPESMMIFSISGSVNLVKPEIWLWNSW